MIHNYKIKYIYLSIYYVMRRLGLFHLYHPLHYYIITLCRSATLYCCARVPALYYI